jgi:hypothetical protein
VGGGGTASTCLLHVFLLRSYLFRVRSALVPCVCAQCVTQEGA